MPEASKDVGQVSYAGRDSTPRQGQDAVKLPPLPLHWRSHNTNIAQVVTISFD